MVAAEGDQIDDDTLKHQFRAEKHDDQITPGHEAYEAQHKKDRSNSQIML